MEENGNEAFRVGDRVVFKEWDEMAAQYGVSGGYDPVIQCRFLFTQAMQELCGEVGTITAMGWKVQLKMDNPEIYNGWSISTDMIKHVGETIRPSALDISAMF